MFWMSKPSVGNYEMGIDGCGHWSNLTLGPFFNVSEHENVMPQLKST